MSVNLLQDECNRSKWQQVWLRIEMKLDMMY